MQKIFMKYSLPGIITLPFRPNAFTASDRRGGFVPETISFLVSNLIYSSSAYVVSFLIPYILTTTLMAAYSSGMQLLLILTSLFELSFSTSFVRFYQLDNSVKYYNSVLQMLVFVILAVSAHIFPMQLNNIFGLKNVGVSAEIFFLLIIAQLSWMYLKSWLLATGKLNILFTHSIIILILRVAAVIYHYSLGQNDIYSIFISTLFLPLIPSLVHLIYINLSIILSSARQHRTGAKETYSLTSEKFFSFISYSFTIHISGVLYLYTARYVILYLTGKNEQAVADMGYAMTFIGIILVFYSSFRNYFLARLNINEESRIRKYLTKLERMKVIFVTGSIVVSLILSLIVLFIKPEYLSNNSVMFSFILFESNFLLFYCGMITLLSKTMNYNRTEFIINLMRLIIVIVLCNTVLQYNLILGFALVNISIAGIEYLFSIFVRKKIRDAISW